MKNKGKIMKTNKKQLQQFKILKQKELVDFLVNRFDYTAKQATEMEKRLPGGLKVQVI